LYAAKEQAVVQKAVVAAQKGSHQSYILPVLGMFAMFALVAGVGAAQVRRNARGRNTRQVHLMDRVASDDEEAALE